ncbi:hypothetical protein AALA98_15830 [Lachnospiraceae bacterium 45-W7]
MEWKNEIDECCAFELEGMITDGIKAGFSSNDEIREECEIYIAEEYPDVAESITSEKLSQMIAEYRNKFPCGGSQENFLQLDSAFHKLEERGIVSLHYAGYTQSDGFDDCREIAAERYEAGKRVIGCCFYTQQDLGHILHEESTRLYLSFGNCFDAPTAEEVGQMITEELEKAGFVVQWDGTSEQKIAIADFVWDKQFEEDDIINI